MNFPANVAMVLAVLALAAGCEVAVVDSGGSDNSSSTPPDAAAVERGDTVFMTAHMTEDGGMLSCSSCHSEDGSGDIGPDIRGEEIDHLTDHLQLTAPHPAKFPDLTEDEIADLSAYLVSVCLADDGCDLEDAGHDH